jgi:predicted neutral ceramidase superfamily lipid hydrolase
MSAIEKMNKMTEAEINKIVEAHRKSQERAKEYREKNKEKTKVWSERARVRNMIFALKAKAAGLTVSDAEIDEYIAKQK